jgi:solute carrier family 13 (sodium-dependent dicarboxylate transporter), member 2/3/5
MLKHGLARRFAFRILALPLAGRSTIAFGAITCALSAFVSNTATVAMPTDWENREFTLRRN